MAKIGRNMDTPEARAFWVSVADGAAASRKMPWWKRGVTEAEALAEERRAREACAPLRERLLRVAPSDWDELLPLLHEAQELINLTLHDMGQLFGVGRSTVQRWLEQEERPTEALRVIIHQELNNVLKSRCCYVSRFDREDVI